MTCAPHNDRTWRVGDRFYLNRWREPYPDPLVFEITKITAARIYFWNSEFDARAGGPSCRKTTKQQFYRSVARGELVRVR